jgi:arsenate reductase
MAEAILNKYGTGACQGYSAGSNPRGKVNPFALKLLESKGYDVSEYRSKSWDEFVDGNNTMDFVFTVCGNAASEICPVWSGNPVTAHWGVEDPDQPDKSDSEQEKLFLTAYEILKFRILYFIDIHKNLARTEMLQKIPEIGTMLPSHT